MKGIYKGRVRENCGGKLKNIVKKGRMQIKHKSKMGEGMKEDRLDRDGGLIEIGD